LEGQDDKQYSKEQALPIGRPPRHVRGNPSVRFDAEMRLKDRSLLRYQIEEANDSTTFASCGHDLLGKIK
jgi:hypothetical protein